MRLGDLDALSAFVGDLRSTLHKEQSTFKAMKQSEFEIKDNMLLNFQYAIDNAPTVEGFTKEDMSGAYNEGYACGSRENERPQGEWVKVKEERMSIDMSGEIVTRYKCSKCGRVIATFPSKLADYYPFCHCGADMRKGGAEC